VISRVCCSAQALCVAFTILLAACGGGGGSSGPDLSTAPGLSVSPTSVGFAAFQNGAIPPAQSIQITLSRSDVARIVVGYLATPTPPTWLTPTPSLTGLGSNWTLTGGPITTFLAPGTYTATVRIAIQDIGQNVLAFRDVPVSYTIQPLAGLAANPQSLSFSQLQGGPAPAAQNLGISELGGANYAWSASIVYQSVSGWLNINGAASASGATLPTSLSISINASGALGTLNAIVRVTGNGNTLDVPVSYTVSEPTLTVSPAQLTFNAASQGALPLSQLFTLITQTSLPLNYTTSISYGAGATGWLNPPPNGSAPGTKDASVNTTNLAPATYTATLVLTSAAQAVSISVTYVVNEPVVTPSPSQLTFNSFSTGTLPATQNVTLATQQNLTVSFSTAINYGAGASGWLVAPANGTAPGPISIGVNTTNLAPGSYTATLVLSTAKQTISIDVTYSVATSSLTFSPASPSFTLDTMSLASALSQNAGVGSTGVPLIWTVASSPPWVTVLPTSGSSGTTVTLSLDPNQLDTLDAGTRSATITFAYTPPNQASTSAPLSVSLNLQVPKVTSVSPYVATSGTSLEVILRGSGFNNPGGASVNFGSGGSATGTVVSATELRVTHPVLAAGTYRVSVPNQLGIPAIVRSTADLVVVDAPAYAPATITYPAIPPGSTQRFVQKVVYDPERKALIVAITYANSGFVTSREIQRYAFEGSAWSTTPTVVPVAALFGGMAATLDGKRLLVTSGDAIKEFDMATLAAGASTSVALPPVLSPFLDKLAVANDGNAMVTTGIFGSGFTQTFKYSVADRTFTMNDFLFQADAGGSADGSLLVMPQNGLSPAPTVFRYNASTSTLSPTNLSVNASFPTLDRSATRILLGGFSIYNANFQLLGNIGGSSPESQTLSPDGLRAYAADRLSPDRTSLVPTVLRTYGLIVTPVAGQFPELGTGTTLPSDTGRAVMTVSPDGGTVFIAGSDRIVVVPAP